MALRKSRQRQQRGRSRSSGGLFALAGAVVIAAFLLRGAPSTKAPEPSDRVVAEYDVVEVQVPHTQVPAGTKIRDVRFETVSYPRHQLPQGAIIDVSPYAESLTRIALPARLPLFADNLTQGQQGMNPVAERIPPGMRAMTVRVDAMSAVEGWARSGSRVDVLLVEDNQTTVVAENVRILSAERSVEVSDSAMSTVPSTVTLLVTQEQCLAINTAIPLGRIAFALRGISEAADNWQTESLSADHLRSRQGSGSVKNGVQGYIEVDNGTNTSRFALSDGKWIPSEVVPEGFRPARQIAVHAERVQ